MQFMVLAYDGTDAEASARRQAVRPAHMEGVQKLIADGSLVKGGAILDDEGGMVGSIVLVDFADRAALDAWLDVEPYIKGGVWQDITIRPVRLV